MVSEFCVFGSWYTRSYYTGAYHIFGGALADKFELLDQTPENGTHPYYTIHVDDS
mgnify:CR=1 FL=1